jgi:hypothetical protein
MTVRNAPREAVEEVAKSMRIANAFFLAHLANVVGDISGLTEGDDEFDYFIPVRVADLHVVSQRIADLEFTVKERFDVGVSALPIPIAG